MTKEQINRFIESAERAARNYDKRATAILQDSDMKARLGEDRVNDRATVCRERAELCRARAAEMKKWVSN